VLLTAQYVACSLQRQAPSGKFLPGMKGLVPRVLDRMYSLMAQSEKAVLISPFNVVCSDKTV
jgi:hypothetical protein